MPALPWQGVVPALPLVAAGIRTATTWANHFRVDSSPRANCDRSDRVLQERELAGDLFIHGWPLRADDKDAERDGEWPRGPCCRNPVDANYYRVMLTTFTGESCLEASWIIAS